MKNPSENLKIDLMAIDGELNSLKLSLRKDVADSSVDTIGYAFAMVGAFVGAVAKEALVSFAASQGNKIK